MQYEEVDSLLVPPIKMAFLYYWGWGILYCHSHTRPLYHWQSFKKWGAGRCAPNTIGGI